MQRIRDVLQEKGIDSRSFRQGEIYVTPETNITIPDLKFRGQTSCDKARPIVVVFSYPYNSEPTYPNVVVAPLSTRVDLKKDCDLELWPSEDQVKQPCLLRLGLIQPLCKVDLEGPKGRISDDKITQMLALLLHLAGVRLGEEESQDSSGDEDVPF